MLEVLVMSPPNNMLLETTAAHSLHVKTVQQTPRCNTHSACGVSLLRRQQKDSESIARLCQVGRYRWNPTDRSASTSYPAQKWTLLFQAVLQVIQHLEVSRSLQ
jgi:hypothetical protein